MEDFFSGDLFLDENYAEKEYIFEPFKPIKCKSLDSGSTDHDLTGQVLWSAALELTKFLANDLKNLVGGKTVLEVGAGVGLPGLLVGQVATTTVLTDGNDIVNKVLKENVELNFNKSSSVHFHKLDWSSKEEANSILNQFTNGKLFDIIIGADVVYWPDARRPLFETLNRLLSPQGTVYISYTSRTGHNDKSIYSLAKEFQFEINEKPLQSSEVLPGVLFILTRKK